MDERRELPILEVDTNMLSRPAPAQILFIALLIAQTQMWWVCAVRGMNLSAGAEQTISTSAGCSSCKTGGDKSKEHREQSPTNHECCHHDLMLVVNEGVHLLDRDESLQRHIVAQFHVQVPLNVDHSVAAIETLSSHGPIHFTLLDLHCQLQV